jgi:hypothetical protein
MSRLDTAPELYELLSWLHPIAIKALAFDIQRESKYRSRPEWRTRLAAIEKAAQFLMKELTDLQTLAHLEDDGERIANANEMYHGLRDVAARAERAHARIPATQGSGHAYPGSGPSVREHCALYIGMAWEKQWGEWPPSANQNAQRLCAALWKEAGGVASAWDTTEVWRNHLREAKKYRPPAPAGALVQSHLDPRPSNEMATAFLRVLSNKAAATAFLRVKLADGPVACKVINSEAEEVGLGWRTVRRAAHDLGIAASRVGGVPGSDSEWQWRLPNKRV